MDNHPPPLLNSYEAAHVLGLKHPGTLSNWRRMKKGPAYIRVGGNIRYAVTDLQSWLLTQRVVAHQ
jgi:hypothetical protein